MRLLLVSVPIDFPLAAYGLAAHLAKHPETADIEVELIDLDISRLNVYNRKNAELWRFIACLDEGRPDVLGFSVYLWNHLAVRELAGIAARLHPDLPILLGGPELADEAAGRPWLEAGLAKATIHGEGEETLVEILGRLGRGEDLSGVAGCTWRRGGKIVAERPRAPLRDLSSLPSPYLEDWLDEHTFTRVDGRPGRYARALIETYRGCYMQCSYCQWGNGTMTRFAFPRRRVFDELTWLLERDVAEIWIIDAMFGFKKRLAKEILRHIIEEKARTGAKSGIVCYHNQDFFDPELFDLYREADVTVEVDLQSTDKDVLDRVGRGKWYTDSFERHLEAFKEHSVPTTGAADLMIGLPKDRLETFEASVDFLLRRHMRVNLYQTSIIPRTPMQRTLDEDGTVFAELAPRSVLQNATFPVSDMVRARLIGHGVDFFRLFPQTARCLWRLGFERPVDLCRRFGDSIWRRSGLMFGESHTHDAVLIDETDLVASIIEELCREPDALPVLCELFALERAAGEVAPRDVAGRRGEGVAILEAGDALPEAWLGAKPRFRRELIAEVSITHRVDRLLVWLAEEGGDLPPEGTWQDLESADLVALVYRKGLRHSSYRLVDKALTHALLDRFSGHFTVAECLANLLGPAWAAQDLDPLRKTLKSLAVGGFITP